MRVFIEIIRFELRQQFASLFVWLGLFLSFVLHLLTIGSVGITLWTHPQAYINSTYAVAVVNSTLTIVNLLSLVVFVANAVLREHDHTTAALIFVKPISKWQYLGGRFASVAILVVLLALSAILGSLIGTMMPWIDTERLSPFVMQPFWFSFWYIVLPNLIVLCMLLFSAATLTRSLTATVAVAGGLVALDVFLANFKLNTNTGSNLVALADHSAMLVIDYASRNLSIAELNTLTPTKLLAENRLLWLSLSFSALTLSFKQFRFKITDKKVFGVRLKGVFAWVKPLPKLNLPQLSSGSNVQQNLLEPLYTQLRRDIAAVLFNPLFLLILLIAACTTFADYQSHVSPIMHSQLYPLTSARLDFFRYGLLHLVLLIAIYFSAVLVQREQTAGISELVGASPVGDWVLPISKTLALCVSVTLLLLVSMLTAVARQSMEMYSQVDIGLYLRAVFLHNGFYYWMICILAVLVQLIVSNKWLGMLLVLAINILLFNLPAMGFEHILYTYALPPVVYSDMNGFGRSGTEVYSLIIYWGFFCTILIVAGYILYPRGTDLRFRKRMLAAKKRVNPTTILLLSVLCVGFSITGAWIFYNTNILQHYQTDHQLQRAQADYELLYGRYEDRLVPTLSDIDLAFDIFPEQERLQSRGTAKLFNNKKIPISEFVISMDPRLKVHKLKIDSAVLIKSDTVMGFYLFKPVHQLSPGSALALHWFLSRENKGFASTDNELLKNGTYINGYSVMPIPGFDDTRKLTDNTLRREFGLPEATGLPILGNQRYLDQVVFGIDSRTNYHVVVSTAADQIAIGPGKLKRHWLKSGRRYFEYLSERSSWPKLYFFSGRYQVARQIWSNQKQNVGLEFYYEPKHHFNVKAMMSTANRAFDYLTNEFGPYPYSYYRVIEYPRYRNAAQALPGGCLAYSEGVGWIADWSNLRGIDYTTIHELAHKWWGEQAYGAKMQGREVLNETLAQYSTLMVIKKFDEEHDGPDLVNQVIVDLQNNYLLARNRDDKPEQPLVYTDKQGYVSYNKGALALYRLQELIGEKQVNQALRNYLQRFAFKPAPFPTAKDLEYELRMVAGKEYDALITELFDKVVTYDLSLRKVSITRMGNGYRLSLTVLAKQIETNKIGNEKQQPMNVWVDVGLFLDPAKSPENQNPLYLRKYLIKSGVNNINIDIKRRTFYAAIDPFRKMADKDPENNGLAVESKP